MARIPRNDPPPFQTDDTLVCMTMKRARQIEAQIERYRAALQRIANGHGFKLRTEDYQNIAREALGLIKE